MIIRKMTASFGMLKNDSLELGEGLNIVYAPNESGKSTWCGFIKAMLFGIESNAREKGGVKPDKVRFAPWSGAPMAGSMDIEHEGKLLTLSRQGKESTPMRDFSASFTGTSNAVRSIDQMAVGETLLGVSKDVFERTAFIGQGKMTVGGSPELEKRVSAIVQTGEEKSSVSEAEERLKAAIRKRRYNKSGRLSDIEREIQEIRDNLSENARESQKGEELKKAKREALKRRDDLYDKVADVRKITRRETLDKLSSSRNMVKKQETEYAEVGQKLDIVFRRLDTGVFGREEPSKCKQKFTIDKKKLDCIEKDAKHHGSVALNLVILFVILLIGVAAAFLTYYIPASVLGGVAIIQAVRVFLIERTHKRSEDEKRAVLGEYRCLTVEGMEQVLSEHIRLFEECAGLIKERQETEGKLKKANGIRTELEAALLKDLDFTEGGSEAAQFTKLLEDAENALRTVREESAAWEGRQSALKDPEEQKAKLAELLAEQEKLTKEYNALVLALDTLKDAGEEISHRITPRLSTRTAEIFSKLTAARYDSILLDRELKAAVRPEGDSIPRDTALLSTGTVDQLYLAVRLAICELALPTDKACPIILDDALVNFDDERCEKALKLLRELSSDRQIVLFTCHRREAELMKSASNVRVIEM
ncbi:MAG: AAA family ATPase [Oscillospiraceae bacterium]|nr:AAA family ATPase [Oscillospiraceae bacterium]